MGFDHAARAINITRFFRSACVEVPYGKIDVAAACGRAMGLLEGGRLSHAKISARTGLSVGAVGIVADAVSRRGAAPGRGWESLPDDAKFSLIKSECYPAPPRDVWIMARMLGEGAVDPGSAVRLFEDRTMRDLVRSGYARRVADGTFYLAGDGPPLAGEIQEMYPEISWDAFSRAGGGRRRARELVGTASEMEPPTPVLAQKGVPSP